MPGVTLTTADTPLTERAAAFLAAGPADAKTLIAHVCQSPTTPGTIAEHMAAALFAGHEKFARDGEGLWCLRHAVAAPVARVARDAKKGSAVREARRAPYRIAPIEHTALDREPFVVVDVETTGSRLYRGDRITEVAVVRVENGEVTTVFDTLINPDRAIPPAVMAITNITWEMVKDAPRFRDVADQLMSVLEGNVFVAHNVGFDWRFLGMEFDRARGRRLDGKHLCTVKMAKRLVPQLRRRNLDALSHYYGIENTARHRAAGDAVATAHLLIRLLDAARDRGIQTLEELEQLVDARTGRKKRRRRPPALPHSASDDSAA